jgi:hypothetical protein
MVPSGQRGPGRRAQRCDVEPVVGQAICCPGSYSGRDRPAEGVRLPEPGVVDQHVRRVLGCLRPGIIVQSGTDASIVRPIAPPKLRSGIGSTDRSGGTYPPPRPARPSASRTPFLSFAATDLASDPPSARSAASRSSSSPRSPRCPAGACPGHPADRALLVLGESADQPADRAGDHHRGQQRRVTRRGVMTQVQPPGTLRFDMDQQAEA